ncbi:MAG: HAMP domain-containing sensor histidine kinase [Rhodospirillales bacterium]|jgi:signal transduction histidine kinase|nr:HAMP domain-containing sensor histidine kinase [Rhodospirillales bacterium]
MLSSGKIRPLALAVIVLVLGSIIGLSTIGFQTIGLLGIGHERWESFQKTAESKIILISELRGALGYGGFIHNFKNLVLRKDPSRIPLVEENLLQAFQAIRTYKQLDLVPGEAAPLAVISETLETYQHNFIRVKGLVSLQDITPDAIDEVAQVSDAKAIAALDELNRLWIEEARRKRMALSESLDKGTQLITVGVFVLPVLFILGGGLIWFIFRLVKEITLREKQSLELAALAEDLHIAHVELEAIMSQKDKMFSVIGHDLRGPFTPLLGFSKMLASAPDKFPPDKVAEYADAIYRNGKRVLDLLNNLLEWASLQTDRILFEPEDFGMRALVGETVDLLNPVAEEKGIEILNEVQEISFHADRKMIDTVIRNLVNNALKFTADGGQVTISAETVDEHAVLSIADSGVGIPPDRLETLFNMNDVDSTDGTSGEKGTGLGLLICKELVERNGGLISVESKPGAGTAFHITLPKATS